MNSTPPVPLPATGLALGLAAGLVLMIGRWIRGRSAPPFARLRIQPGLLFVATLASCLLSSAFAAFAGDEGRSVVVVFNSRSAQSKSVAEHYAARRRVPKEQVLGLALPMTESMTRKEYRQQLEEPLLQWLEMNELFTYGPALANGTGAATNGQLRLPLAAKVRYAVLCFDVPLKIDADATFKEPDADKFPAQLQRNEAAVDAELALLPARGPGVRLTGPAPNRLFAVTNAADIHPTNGVLIVTRLDGPSATIARGLVDRALEAETNGFWGRAYFDLRGIKEGDYKPGDDILANAAAYVRRQGFETVLDNSEPTFSAGFPMSHVIIYAGWYAGDACGPFASREVEFMPGAFAFHLHSYSAGTLRTTSRHWCGPFLARGAAVTLGSVFEPYLGGTPDIGVLLTRWLGAGFTFGEAAIAAQAALSWQNTVIGDPLYRPFARTPKEWHHELEGRGSKLVEWSHLRVVNLNLATGLREPQVVPYLEGVPTTKTSAVLSEKLGDLYEASGKPSAALRACEEALLLGPSPRQRVRLTLTLGGRLAALGRLDEAIAAYERLLKDPPAPLDAATLYQQMAAWAEQAGKADAAARWRKEAERFGR